jgi:phosphoribosyl 1,2-cyclic phosphodiesterase
MKVTFWGARGSIPTPLSTQEIREKIKQALQGAVGIDLTNGQAIEQYIESLPAWIRSTAGGNTTCVELRIKNSLFILDCGSGVRLLSEKLMKESFGQGKGEAHIFISHTHWDHIQGFPFFNVAFVPGNKFHFYSPFPDLKARLEDQQREVYFPVPLEYMRAVQTWNVLDPTNSINIDGIRVSTILLSHPGGAYAYRFDYGGQSVVYATDGEYQRMSEEATARYVEFFRDADILIFDAQYRFEQVVDSRRDWGHSTPKMGAELAYRAGVKRLVLTHHDPTAPDDVLWARINEAYSYLSFRGRGLDSAQPISVLLAQEGLDIDLTAPQD